MTKNNDTTASENGKKRAGTIFGPGRKSVEKYNAGHGDLELNKTFLNGIKVWVFFRKNIEKKELVPA